MLDVLGISSVIREPNTWANTTRLPHNFCSPTSPTRKTHGSLKLRRAPPSPPEHSFVPDKQQVIGKATESWRVTIHWILTVTNSQYPGVSSWQETMCRVTLRGMAALSAVYAVAQTKPMTQQSEFKPSYQLQAIVNELPELEKDAFGHLVAAVNKALPQQKGSSGIREVVMEAINKQNQKQYITELQNQELAVLEHMFELACWNDLVHRIPDFTWDGPTGWDGCQWIVTRLFQLQSISKDDGATDAKDAESHLDAAKQHARRLFE